MSAVVVTNPATGEVLQEVCTTSVDGCRQAVEAAQQALRLMRDLGGRGRGELLRRVHGLLLEQQEELASLITSENGKAIREARAEVAYAAEFFRWFAEDADRIGGEHRTSPSGDKRILTDRVPIGVALLVTPWNFPLAMAARKVAPALAAGCAVVLKPAPETPLSAFALGAILAEAGAPQGALNVVLPEPPGEAVAEMLQMREVRKLSFTGSTEVGRALMRVAAETVVSVSLELGGNAPFLVCHDADLDVALDAAMVAKMRNGGATCVAANRFLVHASVADRFTDGLVERFRDLHVGDPADSICDVGPLVNERERSKVAELVADATARGAEAISCGEVPAGRPYHAPTVLRVDARDPVLQHEVFGPVAMVAVHDDEASMVASANDTDAGLIAYVMTTDLRRGLAIADELEAGMVGINRGLVSDPGAPFGGVKSSGIGREGGREGIDAFLETKYYALDR